MKACIRFFCVSLFLQCCLIAEEPLLFNSTLEMTSTWNLGETPVTILLHQQQGAELLFNHHERDELQFPIEVQLTLRNMKLEMRAAGKTIENDLKNPGQITPLIQFAHFQNKPIDLTLIKNPPYALFKEPFAKQFLDLELFEQPLFEGIFVSPLHQLIELVSRPLKVGEGFQITQERTDTRPYFSTTTYTVRKIEGDEILVDSTWIIERQKSTLTGEKSSISAVIYGELKGSWTLSKQNPFQFKYEEKGTISYSLGVEEQQASIVHRIQKNGQTSLVK